MTAYRLTLRLNDGLPEPDPVEVEVGTTDELAAIIAGLAANPPRPLGEESRLKVDEVPAPICGHVATGGAAGGFVCDLPAGHDGLHEQRDVLRRSGGGEYVQRTNWGSDGLAPHATKDPAAAGSRR